jgi:hypothetical protein
MAGFGELVLVLGDFHIPQRRNEIPEQFKRMLVPGLRSSVASYIVCPGRHPFSSSFATKVLFAVVTSLLAQI